MMDNFAFRRPESAAVGQLRILAGQSLGKVALSRHRAGRDLDAVRRVCRWWTKSGGPRRLCRVGQDFPSGDELPLALRSVPAASGTARRRAAGPVNAADRPLAALNLQWHKRVATERKGLLDRLVRIVRVGHIERQRLAGFCGLPLPLHLVLLGKTLIVARILLSQISCRRACPDAPDPVDAPAG